MSSQHMQHMPRLISQPSVTALALTVHSNTEVLHRCCGSVTISSGSGRPVSYGAGPDLPGHFVEIEKKYVVK
jgi:hypothetical protein